MIPVTPKENVQALTHQRELVSIEDYKTKKKKIRSVPSTNSVSQ